MFEEQNLRWLTTAQDILTELSTEAPCRASRTARGGPSDTLTSRFVAERAR